MVEICKVCDGEGILDANTKKPVDYYGPWRVEGTKVVVCFACDGKLVVDVNKFKMFWHNVRRGLGRNKRPRKKGV